MELFSEGFLINKRYEVVAKIGGSDSGEIFHAKDRALNRDVALKTLKISTGDSKKHFAQFRSEASLMAPLLHKNIRSIYALDCFDNVPMMVLEYFDGKNLQSFLKETGISLGYKQCKSIFEQICSALSFAHTQGVTHGELSPETIFITETSELHVKIIDFGLARALNANKAATTTTATTATTTTTTTQLTDTRILRNLAYMSPEHFCGEKSDERSDIYSLGCILYKIVTGEDAFRAENPGTLMHQHLNDYPSMPNFSWHNKPLEERFKKILLKCLQKEPDNRFQSVDQILSMLCGSLASSEEINLFGTMQGWGSKKSLTAIPNPQCPLKYWLNRCYYYLGVCLHSC